MNSYDLTREQLDPLCERTREMTAWLNQLKTRLEANRFPHDDELFRLACEAFDPQHAIPSSQNPRRRSQRPELPACIHGCEGNRLPHFDSPQCQETHYFPASVHCFCEPSMRSGPAISFPSRTTT